MKIITTALLLFSSASFSQTSSGQDVYQSPDLVVSGVDFESITGCWAKIYEGENFSGRSVSLVGYTTWAELSPNSWPAWSGRLNSAEVGPDARLVLYGEPYFADEDHAITSGVSVDQIPEVPVGDRIESLKLLCDPN